MALAPARVAEPSRAERIRSVVAAAGSLGLATAGTSYDLVAMHAVERGRLLLRVPGDTPLAAEAACSPRGALAALAEFTDIAPVRARDRVRARVALFGQLSPAVVQDDPGVLVLRLDLARASLQRDGRVEPVGPSEVQSAAPDGLALQEAALLGHLDRDHQDVVRDLGRLAAPGVREGRAAVRPYALDRFGFTLRFEYARGHEDVRLPFPEPVCSAAEVGARVEALLARGRRCRRAGRA
ncbi:DUF2470 domain-containing protein [Streptomyces sp. C10-9-1]|uniref:DUF2470 domain-containing protein n=1 Tax=Streptomyces sp. C10-9-1 TaxID=1859285 RepID=UPI002112FAEC|nr:DUF2470 domain-containing protein [Streptomyces sp. C10-9-1]MCQ6556214.1 DUF2470 domain-containing protein [Streptomyces sp. C10-9-1]